MKAKRFYLTVILTGLTALLSCKKFIDIAPPTTSINQGNVYKSDATAIATINSIYAKMSNDGLLNGEMSNTFSTLYGGLSADEFVLSSINSTPGMIQYYHNHLANATNPTIWGNSYSSIYIINSAIEGLLLSQDLTPSVKQYLIGEAKFLRAFNYFYLVNFYGEVPLVLTTNYKSNSTLPRSSVNDIYEQIIKDLKEAKSNLSDKYLDVNLQSITSERVRPNKWAATALLARVYLYINDYKNAEIQASSIINQESLFILPPLDQAFLASSKEAIWQLKPVLNGWNTQEARVFALNSIGVSKDHPLYLSEKVINNFEEGDRRRDEWVGIYLNNSTSPAIKVYYPFKYKSATLNDPVTEYSMIFRLGEQYLILAEAKIQSGDISGGINQLNVLRTRARATATADLPNPLPNLSSNMSINEAMKWVVRERQSELFSEMGHRWLDIKRLKGFVNGNISLADEIMPSITISKGGIWSPDAKLFPIPLQEIINNPNLTQNKGY